jgi:integrase
LHAQFVLDRYATLDSQHFNMLITGARVGEFLALTWADWTGDELHFLHTKNGTVRRVQVTSRMRELLESLPRWAPYVFTNSRTGRPYQHIRKVFGRALERAGIRSGDVSPHTLRHTAITRMRLAGIDDATIMELVGHLTKAMLDRYTHPPVERKRAALETFDRLVLEPRPDPPSSPAIEHKVSTRAPARVGVSDKFTNLLKNGGGRREARTRDLRVANAALSQLS